MFNVHGESYYADVWLGLLSELVLLDGERLVHHFVADAGGMDKMQLAVLTPVGDGDVCHIKAGLVGDERKYVAVLYAGELPAAFAEERGGDVVLSARDGFFGLAYGWQKLIATGIVQGGVEVGMRGHEVDDLMLGSSEERTVFRAKFTGYVMALHIVDGGGVVMVARGIAIDDAILVSHEGEIAAIIGEIFLALEGGYGEVAYGLYKGGAVEFASVDNQLFLSRLWRLDVVSLKGLSDIWKP